MVIIDGTVEPEPATAANLAVTDDIVDGNYSMLNALTPMIAGSDSGITNTIADWGDGDEHPIFTIQRDTKFELSGIYISLAPTPLANGNTWTFHVYVAWEVSGGDIREVGTPVTGVAGGTLPRVIPVDNLQGFSYIQITAESDAVGDNGEHIEYMYIIKEID